MWKWPVLETYTTNIWEKTLINSKPTKPKHLNNYSQSSRKRSPRELEKVVVTKAGRLREDFLVSDQKLKQ